MAVWERSAQVTYKHKPEHDDPSWVPDPAWDRKMEEANPNWCLRCDDWKTGYCGSGHK